MVSHLAAAAFGFLLVACGTTRTSAVATPTVYEFADADVERAMRAQAHRVPIQLRCELFFRESAEPGPGETGAEPKFQHTSRVLELGPEHNGEITLGSITLGAAYGDSPYDGASFGLHVRSGDRALFSTLYQFARQDPPTLEFAGDHGFTGLVYVTSPRDSGDYQYTCKIVRL